LFAPLYGYITQSQDNGKSSSPAGNSEHEVNVMNEYWGEKGDHRTMSKVSPLNLKERRKRRRSKNEKKGAVPFTWVTKQQGTFTEK